MLLTFKSKMNNQEKENNVEFSALATVSNYEDFIVYEFVEPSEKIMNRIEISENKVNIMTGPNTLQMELANKIQNEYFIQDNNKIYFDVLLHKIKKSKNKIFFKYSLINNENRTIGEYEITLILKVTH